jgi:poly-gamma-glutamate capsule biosynthesis protein CapA/YwtB (metallophosphatase superfamily)
MALRILCLLLIAQLSHAQQLELLFIGDVMGHDAQINAAYDSTKERFDYQKVFEPLSDIMRSADFTIANLEVTLAGQPYGGYPKFSSPDELAVALKTNGVDALVTANNHSCDLGKVGVVRTIDVLDSLDIAHTGTFRSATERSTKPFMLLEENGIRVGILNYTYGTNGMPIPKGTVVNLIDTLQMQQDIAYAQRQSLDHLVVFMHWGKEYKHQPTRSQQKLADFLFEKGVNSIIGSHPHVIQPMEMRDPENGDQFIAYSLGNFISNQRTQPRDGGAMVKLTLTKANGETRISDSGYYLTWVNKTFPTKQGKFEVFSIAERERNGYQGFSDFSKNKMKVFADSSRVLLNQYNRSVKEIKR